MNDERVMVKKEHGAAAYYCNCSEGFSGDVNYEQIVNMAWSITHVSVTWRHGSSNNQESKRL